MKVGAVVFNVVINPSLTHPVLHYNGKLKIGTLTYHCRLVPILAILKNSTTGVTFSVYQNREHGRDKRFFNTVFAADYPNHFIYCVQLIGGFQKAL